MCIAKCLYTYGDNMPENVGKTTPQECKTSTSGHSKTPLLKLPIQLKRPRNMQMKKCSRLRNLNI